MLERAEKTRISHRFVRQCLFVIDRLIDEDL